MQSAGTLAGLDNQLQPGRKEMQADVKIDHTSSLCVPPSNIRWAWGIVAVWEVAMVAGTDDEIVRADDSDKGVCDLSDKAIDLLASL
jgi:hypothetical protein